MSLLFFCSDGFDESIGLSGADFQGLELTRVTITRQGTESEDWGFFEVQLILFKQRKKIEYAFCV